jgi:hypothetical protein
MQPASPDFPQGLKPILLLIFFGTAEAVPLQNCISSMILLFVDATGISRLPSGAKAHPSPDLFRHG